MASASSLPDFEAILQRGAVTEPRPLVRSRRGDEVNEISLSAAVKSATQGKKVASVKNKSNCPVTEKMKTSSSKRSGGSKYDDGVSAGSSTSGPPRRHHTPSTLPRTKFTATTPLEQKRAIMELKQKLDFSSDGTGEMPPVAKKGHQNYALNNKDYAMPGSAMFDPADHASISSIADSIGPVGSTMGSEISENVDVKKIMSRLSQVREYLQQATTMFLSLSVSETAEPSKAAQLEKLSTLIKQLKIQEQGYIDLLQRTLVVDGTSEITDMTVNGSHMSLDLQKEESSEAQATQLEQLQQQQDLLKKIIDQQKQLAELKKRQSTLLAMQAQAERMVHDAESHAVSKGGVNGMVGVQRQNNEASPPQPSRSNVGKETSTTARFLQRAVPEEEGEKKQKLERDLASLVHKKEEMEKLISVLKGLKEAHNDEAAMQSVLRPPPASNDVGSYGGHEGHFSDRQSSIMSEATSDFDDSREKLKKLAEVRERLDELRSIVAEYEQQGAPNDGLQSSQRDNRLVALTRPSGGPSFPQQCLTRDGARPKDPNRDIRIMNRTREDTIPFTGYDNRRQQPRPHAAPRNLNWNPGSEMESGVRDDGPGGSDLRNIDFSRAVKATDPDLQSKIGQLQEARERLVSFQTSSAANNSYGNIYDLGKVQIKPQTKTSVPRDAQELDLTSRSSRSNSMYDLDWQEDPELLEKIRKLQIAKEKLKKLQDLVSVIQQDAVPGLPVSDLLELSFNADGIGSSKAESNDEESGMKKDPDGEDASEIRSDVSECASQTSLAEGEVEAVSDGDEASERGLLNNRQDEGSSLYEAEAAYQEKRKMQREELDKLLRERQKLIEVQQQLSQLTKKSLTASAETQTVSPREKPHVTTEKTQDKSPEKEKLTLSGHSKVFSSLVPGQRDKYKGTGARPKLLKRASNMSVEPQVGSRGDSEISYSPRHPRSVDTLPAAPLPNNPLVVSELRRQRDMFEQKKKQRFAEKHQMKQISDNASEGGTFSIRSDIDEGVGVSMLSAEVTTATWGGSTEQSSTEEDSAVGEEEDREMGNAYEDGMPQVEEEEEEEDQSEREAARDRLFQRKVRPKKVPRRSKLMTRWSDSDRPAGKKRKLNGKKSDLSRSAGSVSWAMNVSPDGGRNRPRQQNLTPAHRLMRDIRHEDDPQTTSLLTVWEQQCRHLHQQLASNTSLTGSLLRNQQTLLTMLQSQMNPAARGSDTSGFLGHDIGPLSDNVPGDNRQSTERYSRLAQSISTCQGQLSAHHEELKALRGMLFNHMPHATADFTGNRRPTDSSKSGDSSGQGTVHFGQIWSPGGTSYPFPQPRWRTSPQGDASQVKDKTPYPFAKANQSVTHEADTQTETSLFDEQFHTYCHDYSLFGEQQADEEVSKSAQNGQNFSPFRFYSPSEITAKKGDNDANVVGRGRPEVSTERDVNSETNPYNPMAYGGAAAVSVAPATSGANDQEVLATSTVPSPSKSLALATLAGRQKSIWPSFLAQSADQTGNASEASSLYTSSFPGHRESAERLNQMEKDNEENRAAERADKVSDATSNFSLFEALRDSIYNEVATLIAMNESRPHYLIELFRELQLLTSDYLRQRALYALQDLVTRYLTDENVVSDDAIAQEKFNYKQWAASASEHTPSESLVTSDDEEQKALEALSSQIRNNDIYDYAEAAETGSTLSTPTSSADHPFASDQLGDTVINLDEALQKMKLCEENMAQTQKALESMRFSDYRGSLFGAARDRFRQAVDVMSNSSAGDFASETSSDVPHASVDTQKLDKQIKAVVMELVPFFNERTETTVTSDFLEEMKDLILSLARQREPHSDREEFGRFFHKQLESILYDSLTKFTGKKLNECGEDIITDVSEILFNELAFFKLMQDLDRTPRRNPSAAWAESNRQSSSNNGHESRNISVERGAQNNQDLVIQDYETSETSSVAPDVELVHNLRDEGERTDGSEENRGGMRAEGGYFQDNEVDQPDSAGSEDSEDEAESSRQYVNLELSVSESRPVNSTGSGEEDMEEDRPTFSAGRANAVRSPGSLSQESPNPDNDADESQTESQGDDTRPESDGAGDDVDQVHVDGDERSAYDNGAAEEDEREEMVRDMELGRQYSEEETAQVDGEVEGAVACETDDALNNNGSHDLDVDEGEVTMDDLPIKLTGLTEADLQARIASEQEQNESPAAILANLDGVDELAPNEIREPAGHTPNGY